MGMTIAGYVDIGPPIIANGFSLGNVIAFFRANIHKSFFNDWVNLTHLQERFPTRIDLTGSMVSFKGPVAIIGSPIIFKVALIGITSLHRVVVKKHHMDHIQDEMSNDGSFYFIGFEINKPI